MGDNPACSKSLDKLPNLNYFTDSKKNAFCKVLHNVNRINKTKFCKF